MRIREMYRSVVDLLRSTAAIAIDDAGIEIQALGCGRIPFNEIESVDVGVGNAVPTFGGGAVYRMGGENTMPFWLSIHLRHEEGWVARMYSHIQDRIANLRRVNKKGIPLILGVGGRDALQIDTMIVLLAAKGVRIRDVSPAWSSMLLPLPHAMPANPDIAPSMYSFARWEHVIADRPASEVALLVERVHGAGALAFVDHMIDEAQKHGDDYRHALWIKLRTCFSSNTPTVTRSTN